MWLLDCLRFADRLSIHRARQPQIMGVNLMKSPMKRKKFALLAAVNSRVSMVTAQRLWAVRYPWSRLDKWKHRWLLLQSVFAHQGVDLAQLAENQESGNDQRRALFILVLY